MPAQRRRRPRMPTQTPHSIVRTRIQLWMQAQDVNQTAQDAQDGNVAGLAQDAVSDATDVADVAADFGF